MKRLESKSMQQAEAAQQAISYDRLRRGYAWRVLPSIVPVNVTSLARVGGG